MRIYLLSGQLLVMLFWVLTNKKPEVTIRQLKRYKSVVDRLLINSWIIVFFTQLVFGPIFYFSFGFNKEIELIGLVIYSLGIIVAIWARLGLGLSWGLPMQHSLKSQTKLITTGIYHYSRNPIYLSELIMLLGFELTLRSWFIILLLPFYYFNYRKVVVEEKLLKKHFGNDYLDYLKTTPRFF